MHVCPLFYEVQVSPQQPRKYELSISEMISRGKTSPTGLSSEEMTMLRETFHKVLLPRQVPSQCLMPLVVRPYPIAFSRVPVRTRGPDFWPMPYSVDRESSPAWNCAMIPRTTPLLDSQTSGRENIVESRCVLRSFGHRT